MPEFMRTTPEDVANVQSRLENADAVLRSDYNTLRQRFVYLSGFSDDQIDAWKDKVKTNYRDPLAGKFKGKPPEKYSPDVGFMKEDIAAKIGMGVAKRGTGAALGAATGAMGGGVPGAALGGVLGAVFPPESGADVAAMALGGVAGKGARAVTKIPGLMKRGAALSGIAGAEALGTQNIYRAAQDKPLGIMPQTGGEGIAMAGAALMGTVPDLLTSPVRTSPPRMSRQLSQGMGGPSPSQMASPGFQPRQIPGPQAAGLPADLTQQIKSTGQRAPRSAAERQRVASEVEIANKNKVKVSTAAGLEWNSYTGIHKAQRSALRSEIKTAQAQAKREKLTMEAARKTAKQAKTAQEEIRAANVLDTNENIRIVDGQIQNIQNQIDVIRNIPDLPRAQFGQVISNPMVEDPVTKMWRPKYMSSEDRKVRIQQLIGQREELMQQKGADIGLRLQQLHAKIARGGDPKMLEQQKKEARRLQAATNRESQAQHAMFESRKKAAKTEQELARIQKQQDEFESTGRQNFIDTATLDAQEELAAKEHNLQVLDKNFNKLSNDVFSLKPGMQRLVMADSQAARLDVILGPNGTEAIEDFMDYASDRPELRNQFRYGVIDQLFSQHGFDYQSGSLKNLGTLVDPQGGNLPKLTEQKLAALYEGNFGAARETIESIRNISKFSKNIFQRSEILKRGVQHFIHYTPYALVLHSSAVTAPALWAGVGAGAFGIMWPKFIDKMMKNEGFRSEMLEWAADGLSGAAFASYPTVAKELMKEQEYRHAGLKGE
jgi:hypothetical protein